ncbi:3-oxoacyl-acyl-carrier-protein synthase [Colletotrichum truncatum]|uniref:3-oxoacyl-acyl-carrier-protein synthase n=1 Tax=Colletotrichum truncatum TaxID=5467 RepID=A0ACC3Z294_COLTU|nr:3-oxoacyl-acyl-carrier-protein synthase [Colletotrichum truncatum]KAF6786548.1 3-oxoacyl-acyl-carrier-protein synthase [Colletotrichum truncatum]
MTYSLYDASVPLLTAGLNTLLNLLAKAEAHAAEKGIDVKTLLEAKLADDMLPFTFQYHVATDSAMKIVARVQGTDPEAYEFKFEGIADLRSRVEHTLALVKAADPKTFEARTDALVPLGLGFGKGEMQIRARDYLVAYGLPNFFFHVQTAYSILRKEGVQIGKGDYLGPFMGPFVEQHQKSQQ